MKPLLEDAALALLLTVAASLLPACKGPPQTPVESTPEPTTATAHDPVVEANEIFTTRCATCHGATGHGDGPAGAPLDPHPRNFHDGAWQAAIDDAAIERIIRVGGAAVGKSAAMPPNPDLVGRDAVVAALRARVRSFRP
jgi:mono/diheme cytochrome c family protein